MLALKKCHVSHFPVQGEQKNVPRKPRTLNLHCSCQRKVMRWPGVMCATSGITATAWTCPVRCFWGGGGSKLIGCVKDA